MGNMVIAGQRQLAGLYRETMLWTAYLAKRKE